MHLLSIFAGTATLTLALLKDVFSSEEAVAAVLSQLPKAFVEISHVATAHLLSFSACD